MHSDQPCPEPYRHLGLYPPLGIGPRLNRIETVTPSLRLPIGTSIP